MSPIGFITREMCDRFKNTDYIREYMKRKKIKECYKL